MENYRDKVFIGDFTKEQYESEIINFINLIKSENPNLDIDLSSPKIQPSAKHSSEKDVFYGTLKSYEILNNSAVIGSVECFSSNNNKYYIIYNP
jgi:hypothetical protein